MKMKNKIKVVDLFAGCGGLALGFQNSGFDVIAAFDNWKPALETYKKNFNHDVVDVDLGDEDLATDKIKQYNPDMIIGGPPCQDFSSAGKRNEDLGRGDLTVSYARIIAKIKPKYFLMENVSRINKTTKILQAKRIFKDAGYGLSERVLDASFCGAPQARKRYILIGELGGDDDVMLYYLEKNLADKPMTVREYFGNKLNIDYYYRHPRNYSRRAVYSVDEPSPTIRGVNRPVPSGYTGHPNDAARIDEKIRPLTTIERAMVQTFPENFVWEGSKTNLEQLIGNAVPVKLAEYVSNCIKEYISDKESGKVFSSRKTKQLRLIKEPNND